MLYAKVSNGAIDRYPYSQTDLARENPDTSFPSSLMSPASLAEWNVYPVQYSPTPSFDPRTEKLVELTPINVGGSWVQQWSVVGLTPEEIQALTNAQADAVRSQRDEELQKSDWTQLPDVPTDKVVWADYRQQLRDVTSQSGFPWDVVWPVPPDEAQETV